MVDYKLRYSIQKYYILYIHFKPETNVARLKYKIGYTVLMLVLFNINISLQAQNFDIDFEQISIEHGLSQSSIFTIFQDSKGFLWFGSQDGLNKYDGYNFKIYKHNPLDSTSISDNWINSICEDNSGNIWIGTSGGGLCLFDSGKEQFITFKQNEKDSNNVSQNRILSVFCSSSNMVWIGTDGGGLNRYDPVSKKFSYYRHDPENEKSLANDNVSVIYEDKSGVLWIGTRGGGLCQLIEIGDNKKVFRSYVHDVDKSKSLSNNYIQCIFEDRDGSLWIGTEDGLNQMDRQAGLFKRYLHESNDPYSISNNKIYDIFEDKYHILWIATDAGLNFFNEANEKFWQVNHNLYNPNSLSNDLVRCIYQDQSGTIWIGTYGGGLNHFDWRKRTFGHYKNIAGDPNSLNDNNVWSILKDSSGQLWIGTNKGLNKFSSQTHRLTVYQHDPKDDKSLSDDIVRVIYEDKSGSLWFGTKSGGLNKFIPEKDKFLRFVHDPEDPYSLSDNTVRAILQDSNGILWVGTWEGLDKYDRNTGRFKHYRYDPDKSTSISDNRVRCIYQDHTNTIWIGTYRGLNRFDPDDEIFVRYINDPEEETSISHDRVITIQEDNTGDLWIGTYGGGLNHFRRDTGIFERFTEKDGLANDAIYGILSDENDHLWLSTNKGISKFHIPTKTFKNYDVNDGLQSDEFNGGAFCKTISGEMYFGGINGYNKFFPDDIEENTYIPPIVITSFKIFEQEAQLGQSITELKEINLSYKQNFFAFEFTSLDYSNPEKNQYAYMLEGIDPDWNYCSTRRYANYTNVDGGEYTFKVKGTNSDGVWNETGTEILIHIVPPFWQTLWFRIIMGLVILGSVYGIYHRRVNSIERQKNKLEQEVNIRTKEINERNLELLIAKSETDNILHNVEEGLFLLDPQLNIKTQHSLALDRIFDEKDLANRNFLELLSSKVGEKELTNSREFLELLFNKEIAEESLVDLNPLSGIELVLTKSSDMILNSKYLSFKFKRIYSENGKIMELIVTVNDLTKQKRLARKLEESEDYSKKQMDRLLSILHLEPQQLKEFMDGVNLELNYIDMVLEYNTDKVDYPLILEKIYRSMHMIKGNASLLDLRFFVEKAHEFEDKVEHLKTKKDITGADFIPLILQLNELKNTLNEVNNLINRITNIRSHFRPKRSYEEQIFIKSLKNLIENLANDVQKKVEFDYSAFDVGSVPYKYRLTTREILIQMIRNSIYHGIETPVERKNADKNECGLIMISTILKDNCFEFILRDDGRGLQIDKLRLKAIASNRWSEEEINRWHPEQVAQLIYISGISTLDKANLIAGRGVGMDIVKEKLDQLGGRIHINSEPGQYCEFVVKLPLELDQKNEIDEKTNLYALTS